MIKMAQELINKGVTSVLALTDTECCNEHNPPDGAPIQIAIGHQLNNFNVIVHYINVEELIDSILALIDTYGKWSIRISKIHNITPEMTKNGIPISQFPKHFINYITVNGMFKEIYICGWNISYDKSKLLPVLEKYSKDLLKDIKIYWIDVQYLFDKVPLKTRDDQVITSSRK